MSIIFQEGGGPHININIILFFCKLFFNNGHKKIIFKINFHPHKNRKDFNDPEEAGYK